jgi:hypothetical protein
MENLIKDEKFILVKTTHKESNITEIDMKEIVRIHGVCKEIVLNRDPKFTSNFWKGLFNEFGINLIFNTTYHAKSHGKIERNNHII